MVILSTKRVAQMMNRGPMISKAKVKKRRQTQIQQATTILTTSPIRQPSICNHQIKSISILDEIDCHLSIIIYS